MSFSYWLSERLNIAICLLSISPFECNLGAEGLKICSNGKINEKLPPVVDLTTVNRVVGEVVASKDHQQNSLTPRIGSKPTHYKSRRRTESARHRSPTPMGVEPASNAALYVKVG